MTYMFTHQCVVLNTLKLLQFVLTVGKCLLRMQGKWETEDLEQSDLGNSEDPEQSDLGNSKDPEQSDLGNSEDPEQSDLGNSEDPEQSDLGLVCLFRFFFQKFRKENNVNSHRSLVVRKPVFGVSDQVRQKSGCTATDDR